MVDPVFLKETAPSVISPPQARRLYATADRGVAERLVLTHQHLCRRGAHKFLRSGLERADLEQVAAIGLIKAARRYDVRTQTPFEAYAWLLIVGELMHYVRDYERPVRIPRALRALERRFTRAHDTLVGRLGREPNDLDLATELGVAVTIVCELRRARETAMPSGLDVLEARAHESHDPLADENRILVAAAFRSLMPLERQIIAGVYLLGLTQLELGRRLGISPKRVSRAHHGALLRMRRAWLS